MALVDAAEHAYGSRHMNEVEDASVLRTSPYLTIGQFYRIVQRAGTSTKSSGIRNIATHGPADRRARAIASAAAVPLTVGPFTSPAAVRRRVPRRLRALGIPDCSNGASHGQVVKALMATTWNCPRSFGSDVPFGSATSPSQPSLLYDYLNSFALRTHGCRPSRRSSEWRGGLSLHLTRQPILNGRRRGRTSR